MCYCLNFHTCGAVKNQDKPSHVKTRTSIFKIEQVDRSPLLTQIYFHSKICPEKRRPCCSWLTKVPKIKLAETGKEALTWNIWIGWNEEGKRRAKESLKVSKESHGWGVTGVCRNDYSHSCCAPSIAAVLIQFILTWLMRQEPLSSPAETT